MNDPEADLGPPADQRPPAPTDPAGLLAETLDWRIFARRCGIAHEGYAQLLHRLSYGAGARAAAQFECRQHARHRKPRPGEAPDGRGDLADSHALLVARLEELARRSADAAEQSGPETPQALAGTPLPDLEATGPQVPETPNQRDELREEISQKSGSVSQRQQQRQRDRLALRPDQNASQGEGIDLSGQTLDEWLDDV